MYIYIYITIDIDRYMYIYIYVLCICVCVCARVTLCATPNGRVPCVLKRNPSTLCHAVVLLEPQPTLQQYGCCPQCVVVWGVHTRVRVVIALEGGAFHLLHLG